MKKLILTLALILGLAGTAHASGELYIYNWTEYMPQQVLEQFTKETGIKVVYNTFDSNEAMYAKLKMLGGKGYDIVVPSSYFVDRMRREGLLKKLDKAMLPNLKNMDPALLGKAHDPENDYSIPYLWGTTGIGYNPEFIERGSIKSYRDMWSGEYKGYVGLTDDVREVIGMALALRGHSINDTDEAHVREAFELLKELRPNVVVFNSDSPRMPFLNQEVMIGLIWNGEVNQANQEAGTEVIAYAYPEEGVLAWMDNLCIPAGAENADEAHAFINFLMRPEIAQIIIENIGYVAPNKAAIDALPEEIRSNPVLFPGREVMEKALFTTDLGEHIAVYEKYWEKLKTEN